MVLKINAGAYSFEAANPRHEHEWRVWEEFKLPEGKVIIPGVVTQSSVLVEHPMLVADRIERFASLVGRENVIASTDCGFASSATSKEIHPTVVWAKFGSLVEGARLASQRLWRTQKGRLRSRPPNKPREESHEKLDVGADRGQPLLSVDDGREGRRLSPANPSR